MKINAFRSVHDRDGSIHFVFKVGSLYKKKPSYETEQTIKIVLYCLSSHSSHAYLYTYREFQSVHYASP
jgi:hypothetical protein